MNANSILFLLTFQWATLSRIKAFSTVDARLVDEKGKGIRTPPSTRLLSTTEESASSSHQQYNQNESSSHESNLAIGNIGRRPFLAIVTEPTACDSPDTVDQTLQAIESATRHGLVDLVSIRINKPESIDEDLEQLVHNLTKRLMELSSSCRSSNDGHDRDLFQVVVSSDWSQVAINCQTHGIHVKESHRSLIPSLRAQMQMAHEDKNASDEGARVPRRSILIGTSAHSVESAVEAWKKYHPDYFFVGTCYMTQTHPEKSVADLEGPALPGRVARALAQQCCKMGDETGVTSNSRPPVLAIGGIGPSNCGEPVLLGADGGATIRAVLCSENPGSVVQEMKNEMDKVLSNQKSS